MAAKIPIERVGEIMKIVLTDLKKAGGEGGEDGEAPTRRPESVHPRAHGDNAIFTFEQEGANGPPPCARGQRADLVERVRRYRSTPVRTGTTCSEAW